MSEQVNKQIDRIQRVELTNALAVLEAHGLIDHYNFFTEKNNDVWAYVIKRKSIRITQMGRITYKLEATLHDE